jgi:hypothetical protein
MAISINNPTAGSSTLTTSKTFVSISWTGSNTQQSGTPPASVQYTVPSGRIFNGYITGSFSINGGTNLNVGVATVPYPVSLPGGTLIYNVRTANPAGGFMWGYEE